MPQGSARPRIHWFFPTLPLILAFAGPVLAEQPADAPSAAGAVDGPLCSFDWTKVPPVRPVPRPGLFLIYPDGPGTYSLRDYLQGGSSWAGC